MKGMGGGLPQAGEERTGQMRRAFIGVAVAALTVLSLAGSASAAPALVLQQRFHGTFAEALWSSTSATSSTETDVNVSESKQGSELFVDQFTANFDADGNFTGGTTTVVGVPGAIPGVTSGFSFAIDVPKLTSASVSGKGLPATTCTFDANFNELGCNDITIDVNAAWTGQGPITREVDNFHMTTPGEFSIIQHSNGTSRAAAATGTVAGNTFTAAEAEPDITRLGTTNSGTTKICIGCQPEP